MAAKKDFVIEQGGVKPLPTREYLFQVFSMVDGVIFFKKRPLDHFCDNRAMRIWNTRYAGTRAGTVDKDGRLVIRVAGTNHYAHRLVWRMFHTEEVPQKIDHRDGNPLNNSLKNLREASHTQNMANSRNRTRGLTLPRGVYKVGARFKAQITVCGKSKYLGFYDTPEEAKMVRDLAATKAYGDFVRV